MRKKMDQYRIEPSQTYNMDEKGFAIGKVSKSKRVFDRSLYEHKQAQQAIQDGNREWITLLATICGDGSVLPPGIIFAAESQSIQSTWVDEIDAEKHSVFLTVSPSGWTNDDVALGWLQQVFDRCTKEKAGRKHRLLILDGHGSHLTMRFIAYCDLHRIMIAVYPPHSTHTLQPLDVGCFSPLATNYSHILTDHLQDTLCLIPVNKGDFFRLFWTAWVRTFTKQLVESAFRHTGLVPFDPEQVLKRFKKKYGPEPKPSLPVQVYAGKDWQAVDAHLAAAVKDRFSEDAVVVRDTLHHLAVKDQLLEMENSKLKKALYHEKRGTKKKRPLPVHRQQSWEAETEWWSPSRVNRGQRLLEEAEEAEKAEKSRKADTAKLKESSRLFKQQLEADRKVTREKEKKERNERRAAERQAINERKAERERQKQLQDQEKAMKLSQRGKRTASQPAAPNKQQKRGAAASAAEASAPRPEPTPPPKTTTRGRNVKLPSKYR
jgi:hypothetical protein